MQPFFFLFVCFTDKPSVKVVIDPPSPINELDKINVLLVCEVSSGNPDVLQAVRWYLNGTLLRVNNYGSVMVIDDRYSIFKYFCFGC